MSCKKLHFLLLIAGLLFFHTTAQGQIALDWVDREHIPFDVSGVPQLGTPRTDEGNSVALGPNGEVYALTKYYNTTTTRSQIAIIKYDRDGNVLWKSRIGGRNSGHKDLHPGQIVVGSTGIYLSGNGGSYSGYSRDLFGIDYYPPTGSTVSSPNRFGQDRIRGFIMKIDFDGTHIWTNYIARKQFSGVGTSYSSHSTAATFGIMDLAVDAADNVYFSGIYTRDSLFFSSNASNSSTFISGRYLPRALCYNSGSGCSEVTQIYRTKAFFGKFNSTGSLNFVQAASSERGMRALGITSDGSNIYVTGSAEGDLKIVSSASYFSDLQNHVGSYFCRPCWDETSTNSIKSYNKTITYSSGSTYKDYQSYAYIMKLSSFGGLDWTGKIGGSNNEGGYDIITQNGSIYALIQASSRGLEDTTFFKLNTGARVQRPILGNYPSGAYLVKLSNATPTKSSSALLDREITFEWVQGLESSSYIDVQAGGALSSDDDGNVYHLISKQSSTNYFDRPITSSSVGDGTLGNGSSFATDLVIAKYDELGNREYTKALLSNSYQVGSACAAETDRLVVSGYFYGTTDFEPSANINNALSSYGSADGFIAQYACFSPELTTSDTVFCENNPINLVSEAECPSGVCGYSYQWIDYTQGTSITNPSSTYTVNTPVGTNQVGLVLIDNNTGCVTEDSITFVTSSAVTVNVNPTSAILCDGDSTTFTANPSLGAVCYWYESGKDSLLHIGNSFLAVKAGSYTVIADNGGCQSQESITLNSYPRLSPKIVPDTPVVCGGGGIISVLDCPSCTYTWTVPPTSTATSTSNVIIADVIGRYSVDISDGNGCTYERFVDVVSQASLSPPIYAEDADGNFINTICNGRPLTIKTTSPTDCPTCTYLWNDGSTGPYNFAYSPSNYQVTVTDNSSGCIGVSSNLNIVQTVLDTPTIQGDPYNKCNTNVNNGSVTIEVANPCSGCLYTLNKNTNTFNVGPVSGVDFTGTYSDGDYFIEVVDSFGCTENSNIISIGTDVGSQAPITASTTSLCGNNSALLETVNCIGCNYQWYKFDVSENNKLMITTVFNKASSAVTDPTLNTFSGVELYVTGDIVDLSTYSISYADTVNAYGGPGAGLQFPPISVPEGSYLYVSSDSASFRIFFDFGSYQMPMSGTFGNPLEGTFALYKSNVLVDVFGSRQDVQNYTNGWVSRSVNDTTIATYDPLKWSGSPNALNSAVKNDSVVGAPTSPIIPIRTYTTSLAASNEKDLILNANSHQYSTSSIGEYLVQVQYPNSCYSESTTITIDSSSFLPQIIGVTPDIPENSTTLVENDTIYVCDGRDVNIYMAAGVYLNPPLWSYQWYRGGGMLVGETGFNLTTNIAGTYTVGVTRADGCVSFSNEVVVIYSNDGANPSISLTPDYLCENDTAVLVTTGCLNCTYQWRSQDNVNLSTVIDTHTTTINRGYFVIVTDSISGCSYASPIVEVKDTLYPAPNLIAVGDVSCGTSSVDLVAPTCVGCNYKWVVENAALARWDTIATTTQNVIQVDSSQKYGVLLLYNNGCKTEQSNIIQATFQDINAILTSRNGTTICNNSRDTIEVTPDTTICSDCDYSFFRDGVAMQVDTSIARNEQIITQRGIYYAVITNRITNCADTSNAITYQELGLSTQIKQSTGKICGPTACVDLEVDRCIGCTYQWYLQGNPLAASRDTFVNACGYAAVGNYIVEVNSAGCIARDTIDLQAAPQLIVNIQIDTLSNSVICGNAPVVMQDICDTCTLSTQSYQWFAGVVAIPNAGFQSFSADSAGSYQLEVVDTNNCRERSNIITIQKFEADSTFALDFSSLGAAIPFTYGRFHLDSFLTPASLRNNSTGIYSSLTADPAIGGVNNDSLNPVTAGSGLHVITFEYTTGGCTFSTSDTLEILDPMSMAITNTEPLAPVDEACISDDLVIALTNFTFIPDSILFVIDNNSTIAVAVSPNVTSFAGVFTGTVNVRVPIGARTGKIELKDNGINAFFSPNFLVIQNPAVAINLVGVTQPLCSHTDSTELVGIPATPDSLRGFFEAHYVGQPSLPELIIDTNYLNLDTISGYNLVGSQDVYVVYRYRPTYSNGTGMCPIVSDSILVEVRDSELDSVLYSPISETQGSEAMDNLRRITYPFRAMGYTNSYSGTYVLANNILPANAPTIGNQSVTYEINNGGCINTSEDSVAIWPAPAILDSIPNFLCRTGDTVCIERSLDSLIVRYRGGIIYADTLYSYQPDNQTFGTDITYNEQLNIMEIYSSNGGLDSLNFVLPSPGVPQKFNLVPANVNGNATTLTFRFRNRRLTTYLNALPIPFTDTIDYVVAEVQKVVNIETPPTVAISPVILADTNFCPIDLPVQMSGLPVGGTFYFGNRGGGPVAYDTLTNNIFNAVDYIAAYGNSFDLVYVYEGQACVDSAETGVYIPDTFNIALDAIGRYCATSEEDSISFQLLNNIVPIDTSSAAFFVRGVLSVPVFDPVQNYPINSDTIESYPVEYIVADIYGCEESALDTFEIYPLPDLAINFPIDTQLCLNVPGTLLDLQIQYVDATSYTSVNNNTARADSFTMRGAGILNGGLNPASPFFEPDSAGVGVHILSYTYTDTIGCGDSINMRVEILPLPVISLTTVGGPLQAEYCENDTVVLVGTPQSANRAFFGYGYHTDNDTSQARIDTMSISSHIYTPNVRGTEPGIINDTLFYWFENASTGCRDTALNPVLLRNFTTDPSIVGYPIDTCASNYEVTVGLNLNNGLSLNGLGYFESPDSSGFSMPNPAIGTTVLFYPDSSNVKYAARDVIVTYHYTDTSGTCSKSISDTCLVQALPELTLSEALYPNINPLGSKLIAPNTDTLEHFCERGGASAIYAYNQTGYFVGNQLVLNQPGHITPDTGTYNINESGVALDPTLNGGATVAYAYYPNTVPGGADTIEYIYTDAQGCTDSLQYVIVVDTIPDLDFVGLVNYDPSIDRFVYCEKGGTPGIITPLPDGIAGSELLFNNSPVNSPFQLRPDTLAIPNVYVDYPLDYHYVGQQYVAGGTCADTLSDTIQIRPAPQLAWSPIVPDHFCVRDSLERISLDALPRGGQFVDYTFGVTGGIVADTLFNPTAQAGVRNIYYRYADPISGCEDTIQKRIEVYTLPQIGFDVEGGCQGKLVEFVPEVQGIEYNGVAIDSLSLVIWDFGDGVIDTINFLPDTLVVPQDTHTYAGTGIYFPSLTVWNQGKCDTTFTRRIIISPQETPTLFVPYEENFDVSAGGWFQESSDTASVNGIVLDSLWQWGIAKGQSLNTSDGSGGGDFVWGTRILDPLASNNTYGQGENAWVYSPCFDLTGLDRPMIELSIMRDMQNRVDGTVLQYYDDANREWIVLGEANKGINWYQDGFVVSSPGEQTGSPVGWTNQLSQPIWENARYRLDNIGNDLRTRTDVRFRIAFASDPNTLVGPNVGNEGFLFDDVRIGNRTRNVLVEHFSGVGYVGIEAIEQQLYHTLFNGLYGRDVHLVQYHTELSIDPANPIPSLTFDPRYRHSQDAKDAVDNRIFVYRVSENNQVRINGGTGSNAVSQTSALLNYPELEVLDIEALKDPVFDLDFVLPNGSYFIDNAGTLTATIDITANEYFEDSLMLRIALTEDSVETTRSHLATAVMRRMLPDNVGVGYTGIWNKDDVKTYPLVGFIDPTTVVPNRTELVVFIQDLATKEVYQVISSRNITQWIGAPVDTLDVSVDNLPDLQEWEVIGMKLYPNPAQDYFNVEFTQPLEGDYDWQLIDAVGRVLKTGQTIQGTENMQVETSELSAGMYIFTMKNHNVYTQRKVIVRRP